MKAWMFTSPKRVKTVLAVLVAASVALLLWAVVTVQSDMEAAKGTQDGTPESYSSTGGAGSKPIPNDSCVKTARAFGDLLVTPDPSLTPGKWRSRLSGLVTPEVAEMLSGINPDLTSMVRVKNVAAQAQEGACDAEIRMTDNVTVVRAELENRAQLGWRVSTWTTEKVK